MRAKLTDKLIRSLKPAARPYEVRDTDITGFLVRVQPAGGMTYYLEWRRGKRVRIGRSPVLTPEMARSKAQEIAARVALGETPEPKRGPRAETLRQFIESAYAAEHGNRRGWGKTLHHIESFGDLLDKKPADVTMLDVQRAVQAWRKPREEGAAPLKPATIARRLAALQSVFTTAIGADLAQANPATKRSKTRPGGIRLDRFDNTRVRYLSADEEARLRGALEARDERKRTERRHARECRGGAYCEAHPEIPPSAYPDHLTPLVLLAMNTGLRRGELFLLRWEDVREHGGHVVLEVRPENAKSTKTRHVPLNTEARTVLEAWRGDSERTGLVFVGKDGARALTDIKKAWAEVVKAAGLRGFRFHDTRHHFASRLVMAGTDLNTVRELLGHADMKMTLRYAHLAPEHKLEAVERIARVAA